MSWLEEWQAANNASLVRESGANPGWVMPTDPAAELARQDAITAGNDAVWFPQGGGSSPASPSTAVVQAPTSPATGTTDAQKSARALIQSTLEQYGLGGLADRLWQQYLSGAPLEQIWTDMRGSTEYKTRFPYMDELAKRGRAISEAEAIGIERSYVQIMRAAGIPEGFYDSPDDFGRLIGNEVSPAELSQRVDTYVQAVYQSPPEVRAELERIYGIGTGHLAAFFMDDTKALPIIQNQFAAAQRSATATRTGFGGLTGGEAERLVQLGVTDQQAQEGFGALVDARELFTSLDSGESAIGRESQIGAAFGGDSLAKRKIEERRRKRQATFEGGGGFASNKEGLSGLGSAG